MNEREFGTRRSRATTKPAVQCIDVVFLICIKCNIVLQIIAHDQINNRPVCCGKEMDKLIPQSLPEAEKKLNLDYKIVGGYNENAIQVFWELNDESEQLCWIYLKTFTGGYIKYITQDKKPPMVFALADEDAYSYCDESPCLECTFRCKRGLVIYACTVSNILVEVPIDKMSANWQS